MRRIARLCLSVIAPFLLIAASAQAQTAPPPQSLVVEKIPTGWVLAPDFKATEVDDQFGQLAGVYAGRVTDDTLLIGGAGYWLVNGSDDFTLAYGGLLLGWNAHRTGRIRFGARGLAGVGTATLGRDIDFGRGGVRDIRFGRRGRTSLPISDDFFVLEPQANLSFNVSQQIAVTGAAGYRAVASADGLGDALNGPTVSLGLQFGW